MDRETALAGAEDPPFQNFFIYPERSLKFRMHTAHIKWNTMIVATGDKTDNRWQRVVPGDKLTTGDDEVQRVTTGDHGVKVQQTCFFYLIYPATPGVPASIWIFHVNQDPPAIMYELVEFDELVIFLVVHLRVINQNSIWNWFFW